MVSARFAISGLFSLLKRGVNGVFHHVSREHLARYCDEFAFRYENRKASDPERAKMLVLKAKASASPTSSHCE